MTPEQEEQQQQRLKVVLTSHHDIPDAKIPHFLALLREGRDVHAIQMALELPYRGDVLFATLLLHLARRDGVAELPGIDPDVPAELLPFMPALEQDWANRHEPRERWSRVQ